MVPLLLLLTALAVVSLLLLYGVGRGATVREEFTRSACFAKARYFTRDWGVGDVLAIHGPTTYEEEDSLGDVFWGATMESYDPSREDEVLRNWESDARDQQFLDRMSNEVRKLGDLNDILSPQDKFAVLQQNKVQTAWLGGDRLDIAYDGQKLWISDIPDCNMVIGSISADGRASVEKTISHYNVSLFGQKEPIRKQSSMLGMPYTLVVRLTTRPAGRYSWVFFWASTTKLPRPPTLKTS